MFDIALQKIVELFLIGSVGIIFLLHRKSKLRNLSIVSLFLLSISRPIMYYGEYYAPSFQLLWLSLGYFLLFGGIFTLLFCLLKWRGGAPGAPQKRIPFKILAIVALICWVLMFLHASRFSDVALFTEGGANTLLRGGNPYIEGNHPYLPGILYFYLLFQLLINAPHIGYIIGQFVGCFLIMMLLYKMGEESNSSGTVAAILFAFNPMVIYAAILLSVNDIPVILFLLLSLYALRKRCILLSAVLLGFAASMKWFPAIALPFIILYLYAQKERKNMLKYTSFFLLGGLLPILPFLVYSAPEFIKSTFFWHVWRSTSTFSIYSFIKGSPLVGNIAFPLQFIAVGLIFLYALKKAIDERSLIIYITSAMIVLVAFNKVLARNYLLWFLPLAALSISMWYKGKKAHKETKPPHLDIPLTSLALAVLIVCSIVVSANIGNLEKREDVLLIDNCSSADITILSAMDLNESGIKDPHLKVLVLDFDDRIAQLISTGDKGKIRYRYTRYAQIRETFWIDFSEGKTEFKIPANYSEGKFLGLNIGLFNSKEGAYSGVGGPLVILEMKEKGVQREVIVHLPYNQST